MNKNSKSLVGLLVVGVLAVASMSLNSCKNTLTPSLYNSNQVYLANPVIDSLSPSGSALAGLDTVTIYGKNFTADKDSDLVYFIKSQTGSSNDVSTPAVVSSTTTKLVVVAPPLPGNVQVRVAVIGALLYGTKTYQLIAAISQFGGLSSSQVAWGLCAGSDSILYAAVSSAGVDRGIFKTTVNGPVQYVSPMAGLIGWNSLKFGPDGTLYCVRGNRAIYSVVPGGNAAAQLWVSLATGTFVDMDFDQNHNMWFGGSGGNIYRIKSDKSNHAFPFTGTVHSVRCFGGDLYVAANVGAAPAQVFKVPIINDSLGTPIPYFNLSSDPTGGNIIYAITFSADGDMYAGTDSSDYLIIVHPGGTVERRYLPFVASGVLNSPCRSFAWIGTDLYVSTVAGQLLDVVARKQGAPYYGIQ